MNTIIICEEAYEKSIWCKQILSGLVSELKKHRIRYTKSISPEDITDGNPVYLIGANHHWLNNTIRLCNSKNITPIVLCNQVNRIIKGQYHCVCADTYGMIKEICDSFYHAGKSQIALYGVNPNSASDASRMECFFEFVQDEKNIYKNNGNLENCFQSFLPHALSYDAVICVNGYAAISLVKKLGTAAPEVLEKLSIVSCTETLLSSGYNRWISFVDLNLEKYGKAAITISEMLENAPYISGITTSILGNSSGIARKTPESSLEETCVQKDLFYEDSELISMSKLEHLLSECSELDYHIIEMLLQNATYSKIAETYFLSEGTVKYHLKKYMDICGVNTKQELLTLLRDYYSLV